MKNIKQSMPKLGATSHSLVSNKSIASSFMLLSRQKCKMSHFTNQIQKHGTSSPIESPSSTGKKLSTLSPTRVTHTNLIYKKETPPRRKTDLMARAYSKHCPAKRAYSENIKKTRDAKTDLMARAFSKHCHFNRLKNFQRKVSQVK